MRPKHTRKRSAVWGRPTPGGPEGVLVREPQGTCDTENGGPSCPRKQDLRGSSSPGSTLPGSCFLSGLDSMCHHFSSFRRKAEGTSVGKARGGLE